jgi:hypothetical protein
MLANMYSSAAKALVATREQQASTYGRLCHARINLDRPEAKSVNRIF